MKLIDAVGRGSSHEPRFVHICRGRPRARSEKLVFVGKGITFDSGGLSIKPAAGMGEMKHDMSGAANVVAPHGGGRRAQAQGRGARHRRAAPRTCPTATPTAPATSGARSTARPSRSSTPTPRGASSWPTRSPTRATLTPDLIVDNATLTGACVVALGNTCSGWYSNDEALGARVRPAPSSDSGEQMWRMPLLEELREQIKSDVADVKQAGDRWGGSITAALFLREFVGGREVGPLRHRGPGVARSAARAGCRPRARRGTACSRSSRMIERAAPLACYRRPSMEALERQARPRAWRARSPTSR